MKSIDTVNSVKLYILEYAMYKIHYTIVHCIIVQCIVYTVSVCCTMISYIVHCTKLYFNFFNKHAASINICIIYKFINKLFNFQETGIISNNIVIELHTSLAPE